MSEKNQEDQVTEIKETVEEILTEKKFDFVAAVKGRAYPQETLKIYPDEVGIRMLVDLNDRMSAIASAGKQDIEEYGELEKRAHEVSEEVKASALTVRLRGLRPREWEGITREFENEPLRATLEMVAKSIESIESVSGEKSTDITWEDVEELQNELPPSEFTRILRSHQSLTFAEGYFDQAVDAGFLPRH